MADPSPRRCLECERLTKEVFQMLAALARARDDETRKQAESQRDRLVKVIKRHELLSGHRVA